jgi:hypothetical protein
MQASRNLERGQPVGLQTLFGGLKENTKTLLALGALYLLLYARHPGPVRPDRRR